MSSAFDNTLGSLYLGVVVSGILYGVTCLQTWAYYDRYSADPIAFKALVGVVWCLDSLHQALITYGVYRYLVTNYANPTFLAEVQWAVMGEVIVAGVLALVVQTFFVYRIYRLSQKNLWLSCPVMVLVLGEFCTYAVYFGKGAHLKTFAEVISRLRPLSYSINITTVVTDVTITCCLCFLLQTSRTGFRKTDTMLNRLTLFCVNTGLLTSADALCSLISYLASQDTFIYICFFFMLSRLYSNSLMATLNGRHSRNGVGTSNDEPGNSFSLHAMELSNSGRRFNSVPGIAVKVDTTQESMRDNDVMSPGDKKGYYSSSSS